MPSRRLTGRSEGWAWRSRIVRHPNWPLGFISAGPGSEEEARRSFPPPAQERLSAADARMLAAESPLVVGHTLKVFVLDAPQDQDTFFTNLRAQIATRLAGIPRLRQRLLPVPFSLARPVWVEDPDFELAEHVLHTRAPGAIDSAELRRLLAVRMVAHLDWRRPLWTLEVLGPLTERRIALILKLHHSVADGLGELALAARLLWDGESEPTSTMSAPGSLPSNRRLLAQALRDQGSAALARVRASDALLRSMTERRRGRDAWHGEVHSIMRELLPRSSRSPLDARVGPGRRIAFVERDLAELKGIAHAAGEGVTVNDVVLAAVAGGIRAWLRARGADVRELRAAVPVALHHGVRPDVLGNQVSDVYLALPIAEPDAAQRLRLVSARMWRRKRDHDAEALDDLMGVAGPAARILTALESSPRIFGLAVSNLPGPRDGVTVAGCRVRTLRSVAEVAEGHALRVAVLSYDGQVSFGLCGDAAALPDLDILADGLDAAVDELADHRP